jgi:alkanesulfonate monooxygenase SsuD/methylene tetrahydromethanopterin reductase-like flavin-dependent oxidoreductase (luciferase family)
MPKPYLIMAVSVICAETDARAEELALPLRVAFARMATGERGPFPSVEEAKAHQFTPQELIVVERFAKGAIVGGPERVQAGLEAIAADTGADELMVSTVVPYDAERVASYERVARLWGLAESAPPA